MNKYILELTVFVCGACVMILELTGSRVLAPFVGTSLVVWTSLIGIILGSLSLGYFLGGKYADKKAASFESLGLIIFLASIFVVIILFFKTPLLLFLPQITSNLAYQAVIATLALFALPSVFLGMVSPYAAKLKIDSLKKAGGAVGNLYALSTLGSIFGTFFAGFYLIAEFSLSRIILGIGIVLFLNALFLTLKKNFFKLLIVFFSVFLTTYFLQDMLKTSGALVLNTLYNSVTIFETVDGETEKSIRVMSLDNKYDSAMFLDSEEMVFEYTKFYRMAKTLNPDLKRVLVIGGAGYSIPKDYLNRYPDVEVDVVEIDPELTILAKRYFNLKDNPRLRSFHEDGRTFVNKVALDRQGEKYDAIFIDAFKSYSMPFQLTTKEFITSLYNSLGEGGVVIANIISSIDGSTGEFLQAEYKTYKSVFPDLAIFPVTSPNDSKLIQNIIFVASKDKDRRIESAIKNDQLFMSHLWTKEVPDSEVILTDDYAPVDQYFLDASL